MTFISLEGVGVRSTLQRTQSLRVLCLEYKHMDSSFYLSYLTLYQRNPKRTKYKIWWSFQNTVNFSGLAKTRKLSVGAGRFVFINNPETHQFSSLSAAFPFFRFYFFHAVFLCLNSRLGKICARHRRNARKNWNLREGCASLPDLNVATIIFKK